MSSPTTKEIAVLDMDATAMAEAILAKKITSLEATDIYIPHLQKLNSYVNCLVPPGCFSVAVVHVHRWC